MMVLIGVEISFLIHHALSLKDKRSIVKSIIHKMRHKHNITIAEVDALETINQGVIGIGVCGNNRNHCLQMLDRVVKDIEAMYDIEIHQIETYE